MKSAWGHCRVAAALRGASSLLPETVIEFTWGGNWPGQFARPLLSGSRWAAAALRGLEGMTGASGKPRGLNPSQPPPPHESLHHGSKTWGTFPASEVYLTVGP